MTKLIQTILTLMVLTLASKAHAALVEYNGYTLDESTNIVTGGGLEWLQWDVTIGMSINTAVADIADGVIDGEDYGTGWSVASNIHMAALFNVFGFGADFVWDANEQTEQSSTDPVTNNDGAIEDITTDPELQFTALFGETENYLGSSNPFSASRALFGRDIDGDLLYNRAEVWDDVLSELGVAAGNTWLRLDGTAANFAWDAAGVAFVRDPNIPDNPNNPSRPVNEPGALALVAFGLIGMMRLRRRNKESI